MGIGQQPMMQSQEINKLEKSLSLIIIISSKELKVLLRNSVDSKFINQSNSVFPDKININEILSELKNILNEFNLLNIIKVTLILNNKLSVLVPKDFFNEENCLDYLKFNSRLLKNDTASFDYIEEFEAHNVFITYGNVTNYLIEKFGSFEFFHYSTVLLKKLYSDTPKDKIARIYVNINKSYLNIIVFKGKELNYYNTFDYETKDDILYFILFVIEQNKLINNETKMKLIGEEKIIKNYYDYLSKFIKNLEMKNTEYDIENIVI
ncbi:DUF3822 family protein [Flavobacteriaceae bacterium]|jgi:hypothetical protein|nr:DUF3822 family protein [Flavobacteriaceae bacterium]MDB0042427.1 DUF3822 family protein [Flavobacteriaceae bacterium]MDB4164306.1 DUF3822 family protein [Flavobacteriaceae bacterium]MDC1336598.1 DUF3822 family protein [Flavobacteriaceae bacterium]